MQQLLIDDCVVISGAVRRKIFVWPKRVIAWPQTEAMAPSNLRFVDLVDAPR